MLFVVDVVVVCRPLTVIVLSFADDDWIKLLFSPVTVVVVADAVIATAATADGLILLAIVVDAVDVLNLINLLNRQLNQRNNSHAIALPDIVVGRSPFRSRVLRSWSVDSELKTHTKI